MTRGLFNESNEYYLLSKIWKGRFVSSHSNELFLFNHLVEVNMVV